jgi:4-amino-4-deoxy-L-arabinose transferase-like glycosyltransferase
MAWQIVRVTDSGRLTAALAASTLFIATVVWRFLTFTGFSNDHYAHLALAQQMLLGERPIRDFSDPGWPLAYGISAAVWRVFGDAIGVEWTTVTIGFALGAAFTVVAAHRLSGSMAIAVVLALLEVVVSPRTYSYPKMLAYGCAGWTMIALARHPSRWRLILMSAVIAIAFLLRHDHGVYIGVAAAVCVMLTTRHRWRLAVGRAATLTLVTASLLLPWALYVALNGGLRDYFDRALEYARIEANATTLKVRPRFALVAGQPLFGLARPNRPLAQVEWKVGVTDAERRSLERRFGLEEVREAEGIHFYYVHDARAENIRQLADDPHVAGTTGLGRVERPLWRELAAYVSPLRLAPALHSVQNAQAWLYWLFWVLPVICALLAGARMAGAREAWPGEAAAVIGLAVMTLLVDSGFLRDPLSPRLADAFTPPALLGAWLLGQAWTHVERQGGLRFAVRVASLAILFVTTMAVAAIAELPERIDYSGIREGVEGVSARAANVTRLLASPHRQTLAPPSRISEALMPFYAYVDRCTSRDDQFIVTSDYADVLVLAGRGFASDGVTFGVWYSSVAHQAQTVAEMQARPALLAILLDEAEFQRRYPRVAEYVAREYVPMTAITVPAAGRVRILAHRSRAATRVDRATGWPCFR